MIEGLVYFSPLLILLIAVLSLMFGEREEGEQYRCFRFSKIILLISYVLTVIFYNQPLIMGLSVGNSFVFWLRSVMYAMVLLILYVSRKWFATAQRPADVFCGSLCLALLCGAILISSQNLALTVASAVLLMLNNYAMLVYSTSKKDMVIGTKIYLLMTIICGACLVGAALIFYVKCGALDYEQLRAYITIKSGKTEVLIAAMMCVLPFLFLLGLAPLHFATTETLGQTILPVFMYFMVLPALAIWGGFIRLNVQVLAPLAAYLKMFYTLSALLSVGVGAVGACSGQNIRKIFVYLAVYNTGIVLLTLKRFTLNAVSSGLIYYSAYLAAMLGICVCLFGLKKKGEYLFTLSEFVGAAQKRAYVAVMMLICMFSMLGLPPFLGFGGIFTAFNYLSLHNHFYQLMYLLLMILVVGYAYLQITKVMFFEEGKAAFDRTDKSIYFVMFMLAAVFFAVVIEPHYWAENIRKIAEAALL